MRNLLTLLLMTLVISETSKADTPAMPVTRITSNGSFFFVMRPAYPEEWRTSAASGKAYEVLSDGTFRELWEVEGWYAFEVFLSNTGKHLVRTGNWASGHEPKAEDLAVAFYENGALVNSFSTKDLIEDPDSVERSVSHYMWRSYTDGYPRLDYDGVFHLKTVEGTVYSFSIELGKIINVKHGAKPKSIWE